MASLAKSGAYKRPIVTKLEQGGFYAAEGYHQDFMRKNPSHPYILANDVEKVDALKRRYPKLYRG
jgi:peptide-methionine (S)-S-oxide reductase